MVECTADRVVTFLKMRFGLAVEQGRVARILMQQLVNPQTGKGVFPRFPATGGGGN